MTEFCIPFFYLVLILVQTLGTLLQAAKTELMTPQVSQRIEEHINTIVASLPEDLRQSLHHL